MNKQLIYMTLLSAGIILILLIPALQRSGQSIADHDDGKGNQAPVSAAVAKTGEETAADTAAESDTGSVKAGQSWTFPDLVVEEVHSDGRFDLIFQDVDGIYEAASTTVGDRAVHLMRRDPESSLNRFRFDAVVVNFETREHNIFPLYEAEMSSPFWFQPLIARDSSSIIYARQYSEDHLLVYDIAMMDVDTGIMQTIAPRIWTVDQSDEFAREDFLIGAHFARNEDGRVDRLLLSSFHGRVWNMDVPLGKVYPQSALYRYPAYGDTGSKPPRELIYPAPDLETFVHHLTNVNQIEVSNHLQIIDTRTRATLGMISFGSDTIVQHAGAKWNAEGSRLLLEHAKTDAFIGQNYDNISYLYAQAVSFYDREGKLLRTVQTPKDTGRRMNAYGWFDEHRVLLEHYLPAYDEEQGVWDKGAIDYKLYDTRDGKVVSLKRISNAKLLKNPKTMVWHGFEAADSQPFLLVDEKAGEVWEPAVPKFRFSYELGGHLFVPGRADEGMFLYYEWDPERLELIPAAYGAARPVHPDWAFEWNWQNRSLSYTSLRYGREFGAAGE